MTVELINTGTELMLGRVLNSHQQWLCRQLADLGLPVNRQCAIGDSASEIGAAVREALSRADLVITTGGLGPTADDLTRDALARLLGRSLHEDAATLARIRAFFVQRNRAMPERTRVQALIPDGAIVLPNLRGTAPGLAMRIDPNPFRAGKQVSWLILLPGPTRELRPLFTNEVVPLLDKIFKPPEPCICRTLRLTGVAESAVEERISPLLTEFSKSGLEIGYCARPGQVDVRLFARGIDAERLVTDSVQVVRTQFGKNLFGENEDELETIVIHLLAKRKQTVSIAESCTGGCIAHRLTNVPGASAVFLGGFVTYSDEAKSRFLGVKEDTLAQHGAVSEAVAREMAEGTRRVTRTDYALAVTGIAGPTGGSAEKPVGTAFIALAEDRRTQAVRVFNPLDRMTFKEVTSNQALELLRHALTDPA